MYVTIICNVFYRKSYRCYSVWRYVYTTHHRINIIEYNMIYYQYLCTLYSVHKCVTCYNTLYLVASANNNHTILYSVYSTTRVRVLQYCLLQYLSILYIVMHNRLYQTTHDLQSFRYFYSYFVLKIQTKTYTFINISCGIDLLQRL